MRFIICNSISHIISRDLYTFTLWSCLSAGSSLSYHPRPRLQARGSWCLGQDLARTHAGRRNLDITWVEQCHKPPKQTTGNGLMIPTIYGDFLLGDGIYMYLWHCYSHITLDTLDTLDTVWKGHCLQIPKSYTDSRSFCDQTCHDFEVYPDSVGQWALMGLGVWCIQQLRWPM